MFNQTFDLGGDVKSRFFNISSGRWEFGLSAAEMAQANLTVINDTLMHIDTHRPMLRPCIYPTDPIDTTNPAYAPRDPVPSKAVINSLYAGMGFQRQGGDADEAVAQQQWTCEYYDMNFGHYDYSEDGALASNVTI